MPTVFGIFSEEEVETAIDMLGSQGYADNYRVIDRNNLRTASVVGVPGQGTGSGASAAAGGVPVGSRYYPDDTAPDVHSVAGTLRNVSEETVERAAAEIRELGRIEREESEYYAGRIYKGASLIAVDVESEEEAQEVRSLMEEAGAQGIDRS